MAVWMNGDLFPDDDAKVSVFDHGLVVGESRVAFIALDCARE